MARTSMSADLRCNPRRSSRHRAFGAVGQAHIKKQDVVIWTKPNHKTSYYNNVTDLHNYANAHLDPGARYTS